MESASTRRLRILIVDDYAVVRQGIALLLLDADSIEIVGEAANGREGITQAMALEPDVILMDLRMPEMDGVEATRRILALRPETRILVLTGGDDRERVQAALDAGAADYLVKNSDSATLSRTIRRVWDDAAQ